MDGGSTRDPLQVPTAHDPPGTPKGLGYRDRYCRSLSYSRPDFWSLSEGGRVGRTSKPLESRRRGHSLCRLGSRSRSSAVRPKVLAMDVLRQGYTRDPSKDLTPTPTSRVSWKRGRRYRLYLCLFAGGLTSGTKRRGERWYSDTRPVTLCLPSTDILLGSRKK